MMALTQGAWTSKTVNGKFVSYCDVTQTAAEYISATVKAPAELDTSKPFRLFVNTEGATIDGSATAVNIYGGYSDNFALTVTTSAVAVTDGALIASGVIDDVKSTCLSTLVDPNYTGAKVASTLAGVGGVVNCGSPPYIAFTATPGAAMNAATCRFMVVQ